MRENNEFGLIGLVLKISDQRLIRPIAPDPEVANLGAGESLDATSPVVRIAPNAIRGERISVE